MSKRNHKLEITFNVDSELTPNIAFIDELAFIPNSHNVSQETDTNSENNDDNLSGVEKPAATESLKFIVKDSIWFLDEAKRTQEERGATYDSTGGTKERSMGKTVAAFNAITGKDLTEAEGWLLLQLLKDVRQWANPDVFHLDSAMDCVSYSSLKAEALAANK
jgi:hypothetical protein